MSLTGGLLGIAVHPDFDTKSFSLCVFIHMKKMESCGIKLLRITESDNKLLDAETIFDKIPGSSFTNGGFLKFGPDGKLYVGSGTVSDASHLPQDLKLIGWKNTSLK